MGLERLRLPVYSPLDRGAGVDHDRCGMNIRTLLEDRIGQALSAVAGAESPALVSPSGNPRFGDYQANGVMAAAKRLGRNPRDLATAVLGRLNLADLAEKVDIAGPGFINVTLSRSLLEDWATRAAGDERLAVAPEAAPQTMVVEYSQPNLAKEMHVGHLRSTIIGDALANVLEFLGHKVIRQNHIGDWGTQFGMLIAYLKRGGGDWAAMHVADLEGFYRQASELFDSDAAFADQARAEVVALQSGDEQSLRVWRKLVDESMRHCNEVYRRLGVGLRPSTSAARSPTTTTWPTWWPT